jgi:hypothetical protein
MTLPANQETGELSPEQARDAAIMEWQEAQRNLGFWKEKEMAARNKVVAHCFPEPPKAGTVNYELGGGYKVKAVFKQNFGWTSVDALNAILDKMEEKGEAGKLLADRVVKWTPELSLTEYKKLPEEYAIMLNACITTKPGTPSVELVVPDKDKATP